jgi:2-polyprenyl-6-methoxyphenol hydroxylase-like FAD-dependent oxidoreductase
MKSDTSHAIVIGAGMAGLVAARVLTERYQRVTILERDSLPAGAEPRKGVPHGRHAHGLLARGRESLELLFPGLTKELVADGAITGDLLGDASWFTYGVYLASARSGLTGLLLSRPMLEGYVRGRLLAEQRVRLLQGAQVRGLVADAAQDRVLGVALAEPPSGEASETMLADLVVDASGRHSHAPQWLEELGYAKPDEESLEVEIAYTTRILRRRPQHLAGKRVVIISSDPPAWRFGVALAQEDDRWIVTLGGYFGDKPPADDGAFLEFARTLPAPEIADLLAVTEPISGFSGFQFPASRRRRYERLSRLPAGYLVFGDALCSFNPRYGQGMTAAALQAVALRDCLAEGADGLTTRFYAKASAITDIPWQIAAGSDLRHPRLADRRSLGDRFLNWYLGKVNRAAARDVELARTFIQVANLMMPPTRLLAPATMMRVALGNLRPRPATTSPTRERAIGPPLISRPRG